MLTQSQSHWAEKTDAGKALRGSGLKKYKPGGFALVVDPLTPNIREQILLSCPHSFPIKVLG